MCFCIYVVLRRGCVSVCMYVMYVMYVFVMRVMYAMYVCKEPCECMPCLSVVCATCVMYGARTQCMLYMYDMYVRM